MRFGVFNRTKKDMILAKLAAVFCFFFWFLCLEVFEMKKTLALTSSLQHKNLPFKAITAGEAPLLNEVVPCTEPLLLISFSYLSLLILIANLSFHYHFIPPNSYCYHFKICYQLFPAVEPVTWP